MGRTNDKTLKEAIDQLLNVYKLRRKFDETSLIAAWPELMGKAVANRTTQIYIRDRKLFIKVNSSVLKNELVMIRSEIIKRMNERAGSVVLDELVFV
jgi:predicted nucleic acid-binding Zn ribbon protein